MVIVSCNIYNCIYKAEAVENLNLDLLCNCSLIFNSKKGGFFPASLVASIVAVMVSASTIQPLHQPLHNEANFFDCMANIVSQNTKNNCAAVSGLLNVEDCPRINILRTASLPTLF